ncbi:MAG: hypothetical protein R3190_11810, partial [Thermoanaerobaculia bacterium]|nr:hypothetical protein [Thermoanaerobaculia bacterium]
DQLVAQVGDYRAATTWALAAEDLDLAVRLVAGYCGASYYRIGYDALDWLGKDAAELAEPDRPLSAELLGLLARRAVFAGEHQIGRELAERALALDPGAGSMQARSQMAIICNAEGDASSIDWAQSAVDVAEPAGDHLGVLLGCLILGPTLARMGRVDEAEEVGHRVMELADARDSDHARGWGHLILGVALGRTDSEQSQRHLSAATRLGRAEKNRYLESNALVAALQAHLARDSPAVAAKEVLSTLTQLRDAADNGFFTRRVLELVAIFLARQGIADAWKLDGHLRAFHDSGRTSGSRPARHGAIQELADRLDPSRIAELSRTGSRLDADGALAVATRALDDLAADRHDDADGG